METKSILKPRKNKKNARKNILGAIIGYDMATKSTLEKIIKQITTAIRHLQEQFPKAEIILCMICYLIFNALINILMIMSN